jgi:hypothetical protein
MAQCPTPSTSSSSVSGRSHNGHTSNSKTAADTKAIKEDMLTCIGHNLTNAFIQVALNTSLPTDISFTDSTIDNIAGCVPRMKHRAAAATTTPQPKLLPRNKFTSIKTTTPAAASSKACLIGYSGGKTDAVAGVRDPPCSCNSAQGIQDNDIRERITAYQTACNLCCGPPRSKYPRNR